MNNKHAHDTTVRATCGNNEDNYRGTDAASMSAEGRGRPNCNTGLREDKSRYMNCAVSGSHDRWPATVPHLLNDCSVVTVVALNNKHAHDTTVRATCGNNKHR